MTDRQLIRKVRKMKKFFIVISIVGFMFESVSGISDGIALISYQKMNDSHQCHTKDGMNDVKNDIYF